VDALTGSIKTEITRGNWVVRNIDSIDEKKREIWFEASGVNAGEDPYNIHYYRIGFDGSNMVSLTAANANHRLRYSPGREYFIDTYSRPDLPAETELRSTADGRLIMQLEQADISLYKQLGLRMPEVFVAKGRDGITDIWGIVCRPRQFDPTKKYPVIENIYAGPQDSFVPKNFMSYGEMQSMAELGFIVVQCDGMGTANRSKAFHDVCWQNLADAGLPDRILLDKSPCRKIPLC
jgi:dipeptidyl aminopeptidase/acylaminoacyl peptidase